MEEIKIVTENDEYIVYENMSTEILTKYCTKELPNNLPPLKNSAVYVVEHKKDHTKRYMLYRNGYPYEDAFGCDTLATKIDMLRFLEKANKT